MDISTTLGVAGIVKRILNWMATNRIIGISEAQHFIAKLPLVICSEIIKPVPLNGYNKLTSERISVPHKDIISNYRDRPDSEKHLCLAQYFYVKENQLRHTALSSHKRKNINAVGVVQTYKQGILFPTGRNFRPVFPITYEYASSMLILYKPWHSTSLLDLHDKDNVIDAFKQMLRRPGMLPSSIVAQYIRSYYYSTKPRIEVRPSQHEVYSKLGKDDDDENDEYAEHNVYLKSISHFTDNQKELIDSIGAYKFDRGLDYDWSYTYNHHKQTKTIDGKIYINTILAMESAGINDLDIEQDYFQEEVSVHLIISHWICSFKQIQ